MSLLHKFSTHFHSNWKLYLGVVIGIGVGVLIRDSYVALDQGTSLSWTSLVFGSATVAALLSAAINYHANIRIQNLQYEHGWKSEVVKKKSNGILEIDYAFNGLLKRAYYDPPGRYIMKMFYSTNELVEAANKFQDEISPRLIFLDRNTRLLFHKFNQLIIDSHNTLYKHPHVQAPVFGLMIHDDLQSVIQEIQTGIKTNFNNLSDVSVVLEDDPDFEKDIEQLRRYSASVMTNYLEKSQATDFHKKA